ncbi:hypothetical protein JR316_0003850 [Psilocybe cubensis]|uniref:Uncharacterized protein n=2 Tax=Psilocybe cubensis TaxID=181762 RepID=A0ACB8HAZ5_PSICU|nr:hypothetical protein JR316_0003850 [Psilocybe cubensis]KAH9484369.1 hypothetical protein JR316_0003850 [Psilocybe cubensis]
MRASSRCCCRRLNGRVCLASVGWSLSDPHNFDKNLKGSPQLDSIHGTFTTADNRSGYPNDMQVPATSAFVSGTYASIRKLPHPGFMALTAAANSGLTGVSFFGCREFLVSPTLNRLAPWSQYAHRRQEAGRPLSQDPYSSNTPVSLSDLRTNQLLDSAISGASVVGVFHAISRKPGVIPVMITAGTVCTLLQYGFNELNIIRLNYISKLREENRPAIADPSSRIQNNSAPLEGSVHLLESLLGFVGFKPMPDEEYLEKLKKTRDSHLRRIAALEQQVRDEREFEESNRP